VVRPSSMILGKEEKKVEKVKRNPKSEESGGKCLPKVV